uniref:Reverse transcriptase zinc-binding domain-containing protein n=1 Tax=Acanthochromis polyacanthus TaxID=80966 RepID=A0A3Q1GRY8_9TELE
MITKYHIPKTDFWKDYWTPCKMAKLKLRDSDLYWRCHRSQGTLLHMLYDCHLTQNLWKNIIGFINKMLGTKLGQNPALCVLGIDVRGDGLTDVGHFELTAKVSRRGNGDPCNL